MHSISPFEKFVDFVEKTIDMNRHYRLQATFEGLPVTTTSLVEVGGTTYEVKPLKVLNASTAWGEMNIKVQESGDFKFAITGGPDADRFVINEITVFL